MGRKSSASKFTVAILSAALVLPILSVSASAASSDGNFFVRAQNLSNPALSSVKGLKKTVAVAPAATDKVLQRYSCGPMSFELTQSMVDLSKSNEALYAQGKSSAVKAHSDGWTAISTTLVPDGRISLGYPADGSRPQDLWLAGFGSVDTYFHGPETKFYLSNTQGSFDSCRMLDRRSVPKAGNTFSYSGSKTLASEGRYIQEEGRLIAVTSVVNTGVASVSRAPLAGSAERFATSNRYPVYINRTSSGVLELTVNFTETVDGYNSLRMTQNADGSGSLSYYLNTATGSDYADRRQGPTDITWNTRGEPVALRGKTASGGNVSLAKNGNSVYQPSDYNSATGQRWDGSFPRASNFDLTVPFTPSR